LDGPSPLKPWRRRGSQRVYRCKIFDVDQIDFEPPDGRPAQPFVVIDAPDWVNVIALTPTQEVLLLRQYRFGVEQATLEIPGGMCDPGEPPIDAAQRELLEETGTRAREIVPLGWVHPNPAILSNRCHIFLARDVDRIAAPNPDPNEAFEQCSAPLSEIPRLIAKREITHALVVAAFQLLTIHDDDAT
jgi:ADP-ribose pyrophosphatase